MAFQRVPESAEVRIVFDCVGEIVSNYYHAEWPTGYNQAGIDALAAAVDQNAGPGFAAIMSVNDRYVRTDVRGLDAEFDLSATSAIFSAAGAVGTEPMSNANTFVIRKLSAFTGRSARGRVYVCGLPRNSVSTSPDLQDVILSVRADAWAAVVDGVRISIDNSGNWDPIIVSRWSSGIKRAEAITFPWIDSDYDTLTLATRRKRLR